MENLVKLRTPLRTKVTKLVNELRVLLQAEEKELIAIEARRTILLETYQKLTQRDQEITESLCLGNATPEVIEREAMACAAYEIDVQELLIAIASVLSPPRSQSPIPSEAGALSESSRTRSFRLPKIELRKFNGELKEWLGWWSQFEKIHNDETLHPSDKIQYLVQSMVSGSRAQELVNSYPHSGANYPVIVDALRERFGKNKLLKQVYVRELLKLVIENNTGQRGRIPVSQLFDRLECHLRALATLQVNPEQMAVFLFPMVESSLPEDLLIAWQRSALYGQNEASGDAEQTDLESLMNFLRKEVEAEGQRALAKDGFGINRVPKENPINKGTGGKTSSKHKGDKVPTAAGLVNSQMGSCIFCGKTHESQLCIPAQTMNMEEKRSKIKEKRACYICLKIGHSSKVCKSAVRCLLCHKRHVSLMCPQLNKENPVVTGKSEPDGDSENVQSALSSPVCTSQVVLQTLLILLVGNGVQKKVRALVDTGSQRSYILKKTAMELGLQPLATERLSHVLFGGACQTQTHTKYSAAIKGVGEGREGHFTCTMELLDQDTICGTLPRLVKGPWMADLRKKKIWVNNIGEESPDIEVLIGSDYFGDIILSRTEKLQNGLVAVQTRLGWTLMGKTTDTKEGSISKQVTAMFVSNASVPELWQLETIGIRDSVDLLSRQEKDDLVRRHFEETVSRTEEGRYSVNLPWIDGQQFIPDNRSTAEKRLLSTTNKLLSSGWYEAYDGVFSSWLSERVIEEVPTDELKNPGYYLPHRAVIRPEHDTTPIRPVFDASCKTNRSPSLNDCLEKGPNLLERLPSLFLRFREGTVGVTSDIRKAFLQIEIDTSDRDYLRFLWWENEARDSVRTFRHRRVVFGVNSSPFLLGAVIDHHLQEIEHNPKMTDLQATTQKLRTSLYVDNCVTSVNTLEQLLRFKQESTFLLGLAGMQLRQWECGAMDGSIYGCLSDNNNELFYGKPPEDQDYISTVLGLKWNQKDDTLAIDLGVAMEVIVVSKRSVLSEMSKIFDPMGFLYPALLEPKLILQEAWADKSSWDEELREDLKDRFQNWCGEAGMLTKVCIPRNVTGGVNTRDFWQIHMFCDASAKAYAAVVYLRIDDGNKVTVQLLQAKSRVSPLKKPTIPRMELMACTVGARLVNSVLMALNGIEVPTTLWSDSNTALSWIRRNDNWGTFVGNRVKEICRTTNPSNWRHVPGTLNPADLPSRGCSPRQLVESRWWEGPKWLYSHEAQWPSDDPDPDEEKVAMEQKSLVGTTLLAACSEAPWYGKGFSSYRRNIRVVAWVRRFLRNSVNPKDKTSGELTLEEYKAAELIVFKLIQREVFNVATDKNPVAGLQVTLSKDELLRVKTQLVYRCDTYGFRLPILLPSSHLLVGQLIKQEHEHNGHAGVQYLMGKLREHYWILQSRRAIKRVIKTCVRCQRFIGKSVKVPPASLPEDRVKNAGVFEVVGVDLAGLLFLSDGSKSWIVLFTCAVYRCVHLELVTSLSTDSFLWAMTRFINRRGRPLVIYSDNATNFGGARNIFASLDWKRIIAEYKVQRIQWKFNPPSAPWWGGWWERLVRTVKDILKRILGRASLGYQELQTILCEAESIINGRPLTCVSEDQEDLIPLTPSMFLHEIPNVEFPELNAALSLNPQGKYRHVKKLREELRSRFRKEYLSLLVQKGKERGSRILQVGDIVLVETDNKRRLDWPLAKVMALLPGRDKVVRVARVKTKSGFMVRPLQRLYPLEFQAVDKTLPTDKGEGEDPRKDPGSNTAGITRSGRHVKVPVRYGYDT